ncbi:hypothetical protein LTR36_001667 [Oleoguttula mirabilis]|uniref:Uncharacterized protein n=1 Tax=Oleoguttula mirabilis TaxID=1507867 RepID=A0AAV9JPK3_9PEZI|nr:hypothetical protein LTR36_001667 [Oleoguttula mirabilis]
MSWTDSSHVHQPPRSDFAPSGDEVSFGNISNQRETALIAPGLSTVGHEDPTLWQACAYRLPVFVTVIAVLCALCVVFYAVKSAKAKIEHTELCELVDKMGREQESSEQILMQWIGIAMSITQADVEGLQATLHNLTKAQTTLEGRVSDISSDLKAAVDREAKTSRVATKAMAAVTAVGKEVEKLSAAVQECEATAKQAASDSKQALSEVAQLKTTTEQAERELVANLEKAIADMQTRQTGYRKEDQEAIAGLKTDLTTQSDRLTALVNNGEAAVNDMRSLKRDVRELQATIRIDDPDNVIQPLVTVNQEQNAHLHVMVNLDGPNNVLQTMHDRDGYLQQQITDLQHGLQQLQQQQAPQHSQGPPPGSRRPRPLSTMNVQLAWDLPRLPPGGANGGYQQLRQ